MKPKTETPTLEARLAAAEAAIVAIQNDHCLCRSCRDRRAWVTTCARLKCHQEILASDARAFAIEFERLAPIERSELLCRLNAEQAGALCLRLRAAGDKATLDRVLAIIPASCADVVLVKYLNKPRARVRLSVRPGVICRSQAVDIDTQTAKRLGWFSPGASGAHPRVDEDLLWATSKVGAPYKAGVHRWSGIEFGKDQTPVVTRAVLDLITVFDLDLKRLIEDGTVHVQPLGDDESAAVELDAHQQSGTRPRLQE